MNKTIVMTLLSACLAACASNPSSNADVAQAESSESGTKTKRVCETVRTNQTGQRLRRVCKQVVVKDEVE